MSHKEKAREKLRGKLVTSSFLYFLIVFLSFILSSNNWLLSLVFSAITTLLAAGLSVYFLNLYREKEDFSDLLLPFKSIDFYLCLLLAGIIIFLGFIALIVPGLILTYSYRYVVEIKYDNPELGVVDVLRKSREIMSGNKMKLFLLDLSFIGYYILGFFALLIGLFPVMAYHQVSVASFYEEIKNQ